MGPVMHYTMSLCIVLNSWELFDWLVELECKSVFHSTEQNTAATKTVLDYVILTECSPRAAQ